MKYLLTILTALFVTFSASAAMPVIKISAPLGGEVYFVGSTQQILAIARGGVGSVRVDLSRDNGSSFVTIGTIDNRQRDRSLRNKLRWNVIGPDSAEAMLRFVFAKGLRQYDARSSKFTIFDPHASQGIAGPKGDTGDPGLAGPAGIKGDKGDSGSVGAPGANALPGIPGVKGDTGSVGATGAAGVQGVAGPQGLNGNAGVAGAAGPAGSQGLSGIAGPTGSAGATGATGATGPQGLNGDNGVAGPAGPAGAAGSAGSAGLNGNAGATGPQGIQGDIGSSGPSGADGAPGAAGPQGSVGAAGAQGPAGAAGAQGPAGAAGAQGPAGTAGAQGPAGPQGPSGANSVSSSFFADFYALMPSDNPATIANGIAVLFPQDGPASNIFRSSASQFILPAIGTYQVTFQISATEAGQLVLNLDSGAGPVDLAYTAVGRATGTNQIVGTYLVATTAVNSTLSVHNSSAGVLTLTPFAGGTLAASAHLVIVRLK